MTMLLLTYLVIDVAKGKGGGQEARPFPTEMSPIIKTKSFMFFQFFFHFLVQQYTYTTD